MKIHFVYAGSPDNQSDVAPFTITRHVYNALAELAPVEYYDWCSMGPFAPVGPDDIVIGHPNYPDCTATRVLFNSDCRARLLIFPFHHAMPDINLPFDDLVRRADRVLSITGPYWYDTIGSSKFAHWRDKIIRLDMAIDQSAFPLVKHSFAPPGSRSFYYMGSDRPEKGLHLLRDLFAGTGHRLHVYGMIGGDSILASLPNAVIHGWAETVPAFAMDLAATADCCVNTSVSDANPTTLLEASCWGFPVACTPQSGYWPDRPFFGINPDDFDGVRSLLEYIQTAPEAALASRAAQMRAEVLRNHSWRTFTDKVVAAVREFM